MGKYTSIDNEKKLVKFLKLGKMIKKKLKYVNKNYTETTNSTNNIEISKNENLDTSLFEIKKNNSEKNNIENNSNWENIFRDAFNNYSDISIS